MTTDICEPSSCSSPRKFRAAPARAQCCSAMGWYRSRAALGIRQPPLPVHQRRQRSRRHRTSGRGGNAALSLTRSLLWAVVFCLFCICRGTNAEQVYGASEVFTGELLFDRSPPPPPPRLHHVKRHDQASTSTLASTTAGSDGGSSSTATTATSIETATETSTTLPQPFDSNLGNNFTTTTCPTFFNSFLSNQTFNDCLPFSLLLQTSNSFFSASRSLIRLTQTLDATCNVDFTQCSAVMAQLAVDIQQDTNCGPDLAMQNPMVLQAYNGFLAYDTLYHAGCLTDSNGSYCYADAVTNASAPTSSYIYYLPLGVQLPGGSRPACTTCLQDTMSIFAATAGNATQPLSSDYVAAAEQVQMICGPTFVGTAVAATSAAGSLLAPLGLVGWVTAWAVCMTFLV